MRYFIACFLACIAMPFSLKAQTDRDSLLSYSKLVIRSSKQVEKSLNDITQKSDKLLTESGRQFQAIMSQIEKIDRHIASEMTKKLNLLSTKDLINEYDLIPQRFQGEYLPYLDSAVGIISFIAKKGSDIEGITEALSKVKYFQKELSKAQAIHQQLQQKVALVDQFLKSHQQKLIKIQAKLNKLNASLAEYSGKIRAIKESFRNPSKIQEQALAMLSKNKQFAEFMKQNSFLSGLFPGSSSPTNTDESIGLLSRYTLNDQIGKRLNTSLDQIAPITAKMSASNNGSGGEDPLKALIGSIPGNSVRTPKVESGERKYEFGFTLQTTRVSSIYPSIADFALTAGYDIQKKLSIGGGISYKMGMGTGINNIKITNQGLGFRSYADYKWKKTFFLTAGFEMNYMKPFSELRTLAIIDKWTSSGLIGVTKKIDFSSSFVKSMRIQLFWDFLAQGRMVQTQPVLFRIGYTF